MRAFIVRPFGKKKDLKGVEIDFDEVTRLLIDPALSAIDAEGRETLDIVSAGNIRIDMFRRLLTADLVIADLSIHNANVFYEIGIRHALRKHGTFMMRCDADAYPFDLQTDRYFTYDKNNPAASLPELITALKSVKTEIEKSDAAKDSPVFMSLPELSEPDPSQFMIVPPDFNEEIERAVQDKRKGDLALFSNELRGFEWELKGWRTVGRAQVNLKAFAGAKATWEAVRKLEPNDLEANLSLGTIYERMGDLTRSTQALNRALANDCMQTDQRAEALALLARNLKTQWRAEWKEEPAASRAQKALRSPYLNDSFQNYERAFTEDLNHYYSGLNALALLSIMIELAVKLPDIWEESFDTEDEAARTLAVKKERAEKLAAAVGVSLDAGLNRLKREGKRDIWAEISGADLRFITSKKPARVAAAYREALAGAPDFARDSLRKQLSIYRDLDVLTTSLASVEQIAGAPSLPPGSKIKERVLLFAGHMIDAPDRKSPRFPPDKEPVARAKIKEAIQSEMNKGGGVGWGYAGGASGGDLLFLEICAEMKIPTRLYLAFDQQQYVKSSVAKAGGNWKERFWTIFNEHSARKQVRFLSDASNVKSEDDYLPAWLRGKPNYSIWQRNNLWMLFNALDEACDATTGDPNITLIALWDGEGGDGPGGTGDLIQKVDNLGARSVIIRTKELFGL